MRIQKLLSALLPSFKKDDVRDSLSGVKQKMDEVTLPCYKNASENFARAKFKSEKVRTFEKQFSNEVRSKFHGNVITIIYQILTKGRENLNMIDRLVERYCGDDVFRDAITYTQTSLLQYIDSVGFASKYAVRVLNWMIYEESLATDPNTPQYSRGFNDAELEWLVKNQKDFFAVLAAIGSADKNDLEKKIENIPEVVVVPEEASRIEATVGRARLDPFNFGFISGNWNPSAYIGRWLAERQVAHFEAMKDERKAIEMRLMNLKLVENGKADPSLQQKIKYREEQLALLNRKIIKWEEEYA